MEGTIRFSDWIGSWLEGSKGWSKGSIKVPPYWTDSEREKFRQGLITRSRRGREDFERQTELLKQSICTGAILTPNEWRAAQNMAPIHKVKLYEVKYTGHVSGTEHISTFQLEHVNTLLDRAKELLWEKFSNTKPILCRVLANSGRFSLILKTSSKDSIDARIAMDVVIHEVFNIALFPYGDVVWEYVDVYELQPPGSIVTHIITSSVSGSDSVSHSDIANSQTISHTSKEQCVICYRVWGKTYA